MTHDSVPHTQANGTHKSSLTFSEVDEVYVVRQGWQKAEPTPVHQYGNRGDIFIAHHRTPPSGNLLEVATWLEVLDEGILKLLKDQFPRNASLYDRKPGVDAREVFLNQVDLVAKGEKAGAATYEAFKKMLDFVLDRFTLFEDCIQELPKGTIRWQLLWLIMSAGTEIETQDDLTGEMLAYNVDSWQYTMDDRGRAFVINGHFYQWSGMSFAKVNVSKKIPEFREVKPIDELEFWPLSDSRRPVLRERGQRYARQYARLVNTEYEGSFFSRALAGSARVPGTGRVMIDVASYRRANPTFDIWPDDVNRMVSNNGGGVGNSPDPDPDALSPELYHLLPPSIHGFSLKAKRWGEFLVDNLAPIRWSSAAFDHLVIPDTHRRVVRSLVDVHTGALGSKLINDVVANKGEGLIIALHGRPGTGKTLTAEAVSEHLQVPLYVVSAGELGTTVIALERKLSEVLALATVWKAVLLIDEADIFLEKRSPSNIERNALVGVFLRLLEYYSGVMLLTTNRLEDFDEAFASRFSLTLRFDDLGQKARAVLWAKFLQLCCPEWAPQQVAQVFDLDALGAHVVNGRVIKQTVRTAQALALAENVPLAMTHLKIVLSL